MSRYKSIFSLVLIFCVLRSQSAKAHSEYDGIESGGKALEHIIKGISKLRESTVLKNVITAAKVIANTAIAIKDIVDLVKGPQESKELKFLKEQFAIVNTKMDALELEFTDIKNQIDWNTMKVNVGDHERIIKGLEISHANYMKAPPAIAEIFSSIFMEAYEQEYAGAAFKLYSAMANDGLFQENIISVARRQLKDHHRKIAHFVGYILLVIERGFILESTYLAMNGDDAAVSRRKSEWAARFETMKTVAAKFDKEIHNAWSTQYMTDSHEFTVRNANLDNSKMTYELYHFLRDKYPWRVWFVFTYTYLGNNPADRYFDHCNGWNSGNVGNKVVIVRSRSPEEAGRPRKSNPYIFFKKLKNHYWEHEKVARNLFLSTPVSCDKYYFKGVFLEKSWPQYAGLNYHVYRHRIQVYRPISLLKWYHVYVYL